MTKENLFKYSLGVHLVKFTGKKGDLMGKKDYVDTLKTGIDFVGKMAAKGMDTISKTIRRDDSEEEDLRTSGLFYQRHIQPAFGDFIPRMEYFESITRNRLMGSFVKKLIRSAADRSFVNACFAIIFGDLEMALESLSEAIASEPQYTDCYFLQGAIFLTQRKFLKAEEAFSKCRLLPKGLGEKTRKFIPSLRLSLCITDNISFGFFPDMLGLNLLMAISQRNGNKLATGIATLEQVISVMPDNPELKFFLSAFFYEACWDDKIIDLLKDFAPENNIQILTVQFLIQAFVEKKNYSLAEGILQKALEGEDIDPKIYSDLKMLMGNLAKKAGRNAEGSAYIKKVKQAQPDYQDLNERLGISRRSTPISKHDIIPALSPQELLPDVPLGSMTVLASPDMLPMELQGVEPGQIILKSRDGNVDMPLPDSLTIGRETGDLVLRWDSSASRTHARIFVDKGQIWVEDIGSSNGTWLNQHRITEKRAFNKGDNLLIGKTEFYLA